MIPRTDRDATGEDADLAAITPTLLARIAGGTLALAGFFTGLYGVQTVSLFRFRGFAAVAVVVLVALGATNLFAGFKVSRLRGWAAIAGTVSAAVTALFGLVWVGYSLLSGLFSPLGFGVLPLAVVAAALAAAVIGPGLRADAARSRLRDAGLEAGD